MFDSKSLSQIGGHGEFDLAHDVLFDGSLDGLEEDQTLIFEVGVGDLVCSVGEFVCPVDLEDVAGVRFVCVDIQDGFEEEGAGILIDGQIVIFRFGGACGLATGLLEEREPLIVVHVVFGELHTGDRVEDRDLVECVVGSTGSELEVDRNIIDADVVPMAVLGNLNSEVGVGGLDATLKGGEVFGLLDSTHYPTISLFGVGEADSGADCLNGVDCRLVGSHSVRSSSSLSSRSG